MKPMDFKVVLDPTLMAATSSPARHFLAATAREIRWTRPSKTSERPSNCVLRR